MPLPVQKSSSFLFNSFYIFIIRFFPSLANLFILLYYSRHLNKEVYGAYQNFWIQLYFIGPVVCLGIHSLIITYSPSTVVRVLKSFRSTQLALYGIWAALVSLGFGLLQFHAMNGDFIVPALFLLFFTGGLILESLLILFRQYKVLACVNLLYASAYVLLHVLILRSGFSLSDLFLGLLILTAAKASVLGMVAYRSVTKHVPDGHIETRSVAEMRTLWKHVGFNDILQAFSNWIDKFIVSLVLTASLSAVYYNGAQNIPFLSLLLSAAGSSVLMQMASVKSSDESTSLLRMMQQSGRYSACIVFPLFFFLVFFRYDLFHVLLPDYMASVPVFLVSLFILPLRAYSFFTVFQKLHKGHIGNIGAVLELILACALMYPLYLWLGLPGVALSFIISTYVQVAYYLYHMIRLFGLSWYKVLPMSNWLAKVAVYLPLFLGVHFFVVRFFQPATSVIIGLLILIIIVPVSLWLEHKKAVKYGRIS
jgi:O-antigen/teichoic acid export membrane protein